MILLTTVLKDTNFLKKVILDTLNKHALLTKKSARANARVCHKNVKESDNEKINLQTNHFKKRTPES